jgi:hypothetical protein
LFKQSSLYNEVKTFKFHLFRWLKRFVLFISIWIIIHSAYITYDGLNDFKGKADVAVVLGNSVYADGSFRRGCRVG